MKTINKHYRNQDSAPGGGGETVLDIAGESAVEAAAPAATIAAESPIVKELSPEEAFNNARSIGEIIEDIDPEASLEDIEKAGLFSSDGKKSSEEGTAKPGDKKAPKIEGTEDDEFSFDMEDTIKADNTEEESSWGMVSSSLGIGDLPDDTFESFKQSYESKLSEERTSGREEGRNLELDKLPESARNLIDYLSVEGNTIDSFISPLAIFDQYIKLDDKTLVEKDFEARSFEAADIERLVDDLELDGKLDLKAKEIRNNLRGLRQQKEEGLIYDAKASIENKRKEFESKRLNEHAQFKGEIDNVKEFLNVPITDRAKSAILKKFEDGYYRAKLAEDPKLATEVAMFIEFKDKLLSLIGRDLVDSGRKQVLKTIHNIGLPSGGKSHILKDSSVDTMDAWEEKLKEEDSQRT